VDLCIDAIDRSRNRYTKTRGIAQLTGPLFVLFCLSLQNAGKEVILVTSGAGALGRRRIRLAMSGNIGNGAITNGVVEEVPIDKRAAAAAGYDHLLWVGRTIIYFVHTFWALLHKCIHSNKLISKSSWHHHLIFCS
jgi:hypothetical protein